MGGAQELPFACACYSDDPAPAQSEPHDASPSARHKEANSLRSAIKGMRSLPPVASAAQAMQRTGSNAMAGQTAQIKA